MIYKIFVFKILCDFHVIRCDSCLILRFIKVIPEKKSMYMKSWVLHEMQQYTTLLVADHVKSQWRSSY